MRAIALAKSCRLTYKQKPALYPEWKDITASDIKFNSDGTWSFKDMKFKIEIKKPRGVNCDEIEDNTGRVYYMYRV